MTSTAEALEAPNLYRLSLRLQSAIRQARRSPLNAPMGVSIDTQETLTSMGLISTGGEPTEACQRLISESAPEQGMGATESCGSDRSAWTVVEVLSPTRVIVQADRSVRSDKNGLSESQSFVHVVAAKSETKTITLRRDGYWRPVGTSKIRGHHFVIGERNAYRDPSF